MIFGRQNFMMRILARKQLRRFDGILDLSPIHNVLCRNSVKLCGADIISQRRNFQETAPYPLASRRPQLGEVDVYVDAREERRIEALDLIGCKKEHSPVVLEDPEEDCKVH